MKTPDFSQRSFLERVSLAAREPVYSAAFAWLLEDRSPLPLPQRLAIVGALAGADVGGGRGILATTEWKGVDLLLTVDQKDAPIHVAVENKIKAVERAGQLADYDKCLRVLPGTVKKVFLTLTGEDPGSGEGLVPVSYSVLLEALMDQPAGGNTEVRDLRDALGRLVGVAQAARDEGGALAVTAFDPVDLEFLPTQIRHLAAGWTDTVTYVKDMRLEKLVQRIWMSALGNELGVRAPWGTALGETHRQALLNIEAELQDFPGYTVGLQVQSRTLKAFCAPFPYPERANQDQHRNVEILLEQIREGFGLSSDHRPSSAGNRGFRSFSVAKLPEGRNREEWLDVVRPHHARLVAAFPRVRPSVPSGGGE